MTAPARPPARRAAPARTRGLRRSKRPTPSSSSAASGWSTSSPARLGEDRCSPSSGRREREVVATPRRPAAGSRRTSCRAAGERRRPSCGAAAPSAGRARRRRRRPVRGALRAGRDAERREFVDAARRRGLGSGAPRDRPARAARRFLRATSRRTSSSPIWSAPNHVLLGPMSLGELRRAIEGPAERVGPERRARARRCARRRRRRRARRTAAALDRACSTSGATATATATLAAYERSGGVRGAVGRHAEAAFRSLDDDEQQIARRILLRLVAGGDGEPLTRRRASRGELDADERRARRARGREAGRAPAARRG